MTPPDQLRDLLERVTELVLSNVDAYGWSIPVGLGYSPSGERFVVAAESRNQDAPHDPEKHTQSILYQIKRMINQGELDAVAFARDLICTVASDDGPRETAAVKVLLDHRTGGGHTAYVLYHVAEGKAVPDELLYEELAEPLFPADE